MHSPIWNNGKPGFPAAVGMRTLSCNRLHGLTFGAFAQAVPDRLMGAPASGGPIMNVNTTDIKSGRRDHGSNKPHDRGLWRQCQPRW